MTTAPETFDVEAWIKDANLPRESATVYKRADVVSKLTALKHRIEIARADDSGERTSGGKSELQSLEDEYVNLLKVFSGSAITVHVRALSRQELRDLHEAHTKAMEGKGLKPAEENELFGYDLLAAAIVAVEPVGKPEQPASLTTAQVRALEEAIGATQLTAILAARQTAQNALPTVDADFLHRPSGTSDGSRG
ncbi:hypothetical protein [Paenarthrobacter ureafaciens]|uniref:hypothetical protein n=1 Tax=Paenarthrobacter ureafaciens TaxID=37931 RepID=UPI0009AD2D09|nr:hypothetical protein [Paenarthrobacter ureafaciens]GLU58574.1 hypothetical protein Pure01_10870 [Paenarthrobacter ureafaciens]GLU61819.1 hypothetical protein Pure02_00690 [Paenarthrobacter ureafaciens]GLU66093.1 hypothetical protein Pure03_00690 [Paenarthrobacter ureafaciens]GLU71583.1 hypothetical protein Pure04_12980 [Paenarthrobacter ureafaciens]GLU74630.1 hypothetical protein Pure05_00700 [Paenarthrobacter ureafaciens]